MNGSANRRPKFLGVLAAVMLATAPLAQAPPRSLSAGATVVFEQAQLIKPIEATNSAVAYALAPLLIQEVKGTNTVSVRPSEVFFRFGSTRLHGREYPQVSYWWRREAAELSPGAPEPGRATKQPASDRWQGLRQTLDDSGRPVIYEVLADPAAIAQIYIAQSVEAAARAEFGSALPGRRFATEASLDAAPRVVVPRVIEDAPAVMGPILYLRAGTHEVATLICRCMASQAIQLVGTGYYKLIDAHPPTAITSPPGQLEAVLRFPRPTAIDTNTPH
jgi:hypothetical protein